MTGRIDVVSIFPQYLDPLNLSLVGKARRDGLLDITVHDLRDWATDAHRTVDDAPFGGGAGMVMRPDIWGRALDEVFSQGQHHVRTLVLPSPAGEPLTQTTAEELALMVAAGAQLVLACGRYEGIDARVAHHYQAGEQIEVREISIGDYVLNGGEAAALVIIEALARLLPGVVGNPESLVEESHGSGGLLEYPAYTRPTYWRDQEVPEVLRSGDHDRIRRWRRARAVQRTAQRRPDLLEAAGPVQVRPAKAADLEELAEVAAVTFPLACPAHIASEDVQAFIDTNLNPQRLRTYMRSREHTILLATLGGAIVGYTLLGYEEPRSEDVRAVVRARPCVELSKIYVLPEHHRRGVGAALVREAIADAGRRPVDSVWLGVSQLNERAQQFYRSQGFTRVGERTFNVGSSIESDFVMELTLAREPA